MGPGSFEEQENRDRPFARRSPAASARLRTILHGADRRMWSARDSAVFLTGQKERKRERESETEEISLRPTVETQHTTSDHNPESHPIRLKLQSCPA